MIPPGDKHVRPRRISFCRTMTKSCRLKRLWICGRARHVYTPRMAITRIVFTLALCAQSFLVAAAPDWIWSTKERRADTPAVFTRDFSITTRPATARLRALADFASLAVTINGRIVGEAEAYGPWIELDAAPFLKVGKNTLTLRARSVAGPAAVALQLDLEKPIATGVDWRMEGIATPPIVFGNLAAESFWAAPDLTLHESDDYTQWKRAVSGGNGTSPAALRTLPGYEVQLLRSAHTNEGSWVSMAFDPQRRLTLSKEDRGLLRLTLDGKPQSVTKVEHIVGLKDELRECRGLLYAHGSLYASANNSKALFRLTDTDGDGRFDTQEKLHDFIGGTGHGRNDLTLGPDGKIYLIHGDDIHHSTNATDRTSPLRRLRQPFRPNEGHLTRLDADGKRLEILSAGLRNPYGVAINADGEAFTYDADAEHDMGAPWYRPTRVNHLTSGTDFGWRAVTGSWPPYFPDQPHFAAPVLDIGKGSPTAVEFGTRSHFPDAHRNALFILDWTYGRILAVHLTPHGASYRGRAEEFLRGRPLNVTDLAFGPDGAMYFITGGRKTQSSLYRVAYTGAAKPFPVLTAQQTARNAFSAEARAQRRKMESFHLSQNVSDIAPIWPNLGSADPRIANAARVALEHHPVSQWRDAALTVKNTGAALPAWMALLAADNATAPAITERLLKLDLAALPVSQQLAALHLHNECRAAAPSLSSAAVLRQLDPLFPAARWELNQALAPLLVQLRATNLVPRAMALLQSAQRQEERMHLLFVLRMVSEGWTPTLRRDYFTALGETSHYLGGDGMPKFVERIRQDAMIGLTPAEKESLAAVLKGPPALPPLPDLAGRKFVREWKMADLAGALEFERGTRNWTNGRALFSVAMCARCHRVASEGYPVGPDLTHVASRFGRRDLLEAIVDPSKAVAQNYHTDKLTLTDGRTLTGRVVPHLDYRSPDLLFAEDALFADRTMVIPKTSVRAHAKSEVSLMPVGLLNGLSRDEILDLLFYLESNGVLPK